VAITGVWERPLPLLEMSMAGPLGGARIRERPPPLSETSMADPLGGDAGICQCPPPMSKMSMARPQAPWGVWSPVMIRECVVTYMGSIDESNYVHESHSPCT
jgi:uncharacterized protein (DUF2236 family)